MIPQAFEYHAPKSLAEASRLVAQFAQLESASGGWTRPLPSPPPMFDTSGPCCLTDGKAGARFQVSGFRQERDLAR